jgi:hypothetical protein
VSNIVSLVGIGLLVLAGAMALWLQLFCMVAKAALSTLMNISSIHSGSVQLINH